MERPVDDSQMTDENVEPDLWMTADGLAGDAAVLNQVVVDAVNKIHLQDMGCQMSHVHAGVETCIALTLAAGTVVFCSLWTVLICR